MAVNKNQDKTKKKKEKFHDRYPKEIQPMYEPAVFMRNSLHAFFLFGDEDLKDYPVPYSVTRAFEECFGKVLPDFSRIMHGRNRLN